jgi:CYTH domain-containing protein
LVALFCASKRLVVKEPPCFSYGGVSEETAKQLISDYEKSGSKAIKKTIEQHYLFKKNASVIYDTENNIWNVTLKTGSKSELFLFEELKSPDIANNVLSQHAGMDLLDTPCATRIRIMNGEPIFTFKTPVVNGDGDYEFERNIQEPIENNQLFLDFIKNDPYKVNKDRFVIKKDDFDYEIDFFEDVDLSKQNHELDISALESTELCLLEIEFDNQEAHDNFAIDITNIEVTNTKGFGNKGMAKKIGEKSLKKTKKNKFKR